MTKQAEISFELNEEMLGIIAKEFSIQELVDKFAQAISGKKPGEIEKIAEDIFTRYAVDWIRKSKQLGEEYSDRTYQVLMEQIDATGGHMRFPLVPQRILEIAYLSTQEMELLPILENNSKRLVYWLDACKVFPLIKEKCGEEVANMLPCRHACLTACHTLFTDFDYPEVLVEMEGTTNKDGYCQFSIKRL